MKGGDAEAPADEPAPAEFVSRPSTMAMLRARGEPVRRIDADDVYGDADDADASVAAWRRRDGPLELMLGRRVRIRKTETSKPCNAC